MVPYAKKSQKRRYESPYAEQELGKVLSLVKTLVVGLAYLYLPSTGTPKLRFLRSQHAFEQASDQPCSRLAPSSYSALSLLLRDLKVESGNESMDGESHPLILDLSLESEFDRLGLTPFLMIEVFEPFLSLKPSIPSFFNPSVSLSHFLSRLPISAKRLA